jgi:hypothetical protein
MFTHLTGKMGKYKVSILIVKLDPKHGIREGIPDYPLYFYRFFFSHNNSLA